MEDERTKLEELLRLASLGRPLEHGERRLLTTALREVDALRRMEDEISVLSRRMREDAKDLLLRDAVLDEEDAVAAWLRGRGAMLPAQREAERTSSDAPGDDEALVAALPDVRNGVTEAMMDAGIDASPLFLCNDRGGRRLRSSLSTVQCREIYLAMRAAMTPAEVEDEPVAAAARIIWDSFHARHGGDFDGALETIAGQQTLAVARAALKAACVFPLDPTGPARQTTLVVFDRLFPAEIDDDMMETFAEVSTDAKAEARADNERRGRNHPHAIAEVQWLPQSYAAMRASRRDALFGRPVAADSSFGDSK